MQRALALALRGAGHVAPNPMVGAVLVYEDEIIAEGWHHKYGDVHAEVDCLQNVPDSKCHLISQSTMYVTLEPCAHYGKQPPCAARLVKEGVRKVVIAADDPFPEVAGKGIQILKDGGIETERGILEIEARWLNRRFFTFHQQRRPYIILKWARSADGFIAPVDGTRTVLSNHFSHTLSHKWRTEEAAIIVGYNTALKDNPKLTARHWQGLHPLRIAIDRKLQLPPSHYLMDNESDTWILNGVKTAQHDNVFYKEVDFNDDVAVQVCKLMFEAGKTSLIVEGGAVLLQSFINADLWDEARVFDAPAVLGTGIAEPQLEGAERVMIMPVGEDSLSVWLSKKTTFSYPAAPST